MAEVEATKFFTDREEPRAAFWAKYEAMKAATPGQSSQVLTYYGIGGIGKTSLLERLGQELQDAKKRQTPKQTPETEKNQQDKPLFVEFNFEIHQESGAVLERLKNLLREKYGFSFPLFEIGSYLYAKKAGEDPDSPEEKQLADKSPGLKLAMDIAGEIPIVSTIAHVFSFLDQGAAMLRTYRKTHPQELKELEQMSAQQLHQVLPGLFARDLTAALKGAKTPLVILLDTYERVVDELSSVGSPLSRDLWLRDAKGVIRNTPDTLWVIAGREKLKWDELDTYWKNGLEQHLLGELSQADGVGFLKKAGVKDEALARQLYDLTKGNPLYLNICVEQYGQLVGQGIEPEISLFGNDVEKLVERFVRYMDKSQKELVYILSCMHSWDDALVKDAAFAILRNFSRLDYKRIKTLSFVLPADNKTYHIHRTVGDILRKDPDNDLQTETAEFLIRHFSELLRGKTPYDPEYTGALRHMIHGGLLLYRQPDKLWAFYEKNIKFYVGALIRYGFYAQADEVLDLLWRRAAQRKLTRLYAAVLRDKAWVLQETKTDVLGAQMLASRAIVLYTVLLGPDHPDTLKAMTRLASVFFTQKQYKSALTLAQRVLEKRRKLLGEDHPDTVSAMADQAAALWGVKRYEEALYLQEQLVEKHRVLYGEDDPKTLGAVFNLACTYAKMNRDADALPLWEWVLDKRRVVLGEEHPQTIMTISNLAATYVCLGRFEEALPLQQQVLESSRKLFGEDYPATVQAMRNFARNLKKLGREEEAVALWTQARKKEMQFSRKKPRRTPEILEKQDVADKLMLQPYGELEEKAAQLRERRKQLGDDHPDTVETMEQLAEVLGKVGQPELASAMWELVWQKRRAQLGEAHPNTVRTLERLVESVEKTYKSGSEEYAQVPERRKALLEVYRQTKNRNDPRFRSVMEKQAHSYLRLGLYEEELPLRQEILQIKQTQGCEESEVWQARRNLARAYENLKQYDKAWPLRMQFLEHCRSLSDGKLWDFEQAIAELAATLSAMGQYEKAITLREQLVDMIPQEQRGMFISHQMHALADDYEQVGQPEKAQALRESAKWRGPAFLPMTPPD